MPQTILNLEMYNTVENTDKENIYLYILKENCGVYIYFYIFAKKIVVRIIICHKQI